MVSFHSKGTLWSYWSLQTPGTNVSTSAHCVLFPHMCEWSWGQCDTHFVFFTSGPWTEAIPVEFHCFILCHAQTCVLVIKWSGKGKTYKFASCFSFKFSICQYPGVDWNNYSCWDFDFTPGHPHANHQTAYFSRLTLGYLLMYLAPD